MLKRWTIYSPEFMQYGGWADPPEAPEYGCDVIEIEAETKRDALVLATKAMLEDHRRYSWCRENRENDQHPSTGLKVERSGCEKHGWTVEECPCVTEALAE